MTVFNFPDTSGKPTDGTFTWTAPNGLLYSWDGDAWRTLGGGGDGNASITITDDLSTIPAPDAGDLAWHTIEARMYIYYQDDDSQQWVDASPAGDSDSLWERIGTTLQPAIDGDDISVGAGTFTGRLDVKDTGDLVVRNADGYLISPNTIDGANYPLGIARTGQGIKAGFKSDGSLRIGFDVNSIETSPNITLGADGTVKVGSIDISRTNTNGVESSWSTANGGNIDIQASNAVVASSNVLNIYRGTTRTFRFTAGGDGSCSGTFTDNTSDIKFKTNIIDAPDQTSDVKDLQLRTFL